MQEISGRSSQRRARLVLITALLGLTGCSAKNPSGIPPAVTVESSVHQALSKVPPDADSHLRAAALTTWMTENIQPLRHQPAPDANGVLTSRTADPVSSAFLFTAMLTRLNMQSRTHMFTGVPGFGWYPMVEVLDEDGDHLWDPFTGRYAPDYDGTPLGLTEALASATILGPTGAPYQPDPAKLGAPSFSELATRERFVWNAKVASPVVARIDFSEQSRFDIGNTGLGNAGEYWPGFAVAGVTSNELGPVVLMHSYALAGLVSGKSYELRLTLARGNSANLLVMADGIALRSRTVSGDTTKLLFSGAATQATVNIGTVMPSFVGFRTIRWSRK